MKRVKHFTPDFNAPGYILSIHFDKHQKPEMLLMTAAVF
jgi:hypothetical protein